MSLRQDPTVLAFYRYRLMRRETQLLAAYRLNGRRPRISLGAYWRVSFIPLVLGLIFFGVRALYTTLDISAGAAQGMAGVAAAMTLVGLVFADIQLFVVNTPAWAFATRTLNWPAVAQKLNQLSPRSDGAPWDLSVAAPPTSWEQTPVPPAFISAAAKSYLAMARTPPTLTDTLMQGGEVRALGLFTLLLAGTALFLPPLLTMGLPLILFFAAFPAKRLKARLDFWVTWPELREVFNWTEIERLAGQKGRDKP